ncbi:hypothetical protein NSK_005875 [Nannochloropsis salina CCMP1776]|uniref:Glutaredoxin domain-containing protein n=1 Tax=Nannochloropsis salina CCMP1776 TaxID=1027361 RepID=A0A4D9D2H3_9STRA|nr:hypothetical protein NSK_005875 [Nannochloropsis salina CCMP1776]|eukprot:TFJ82799.1 hypothetical protein NSK_005875 [Nannochloropsis salina CCMP1776]
MPWVPRAASGLSLLRSNSSSRTASLFALLVLGTLATTLSHAFLISNSQPGSSSIARLPASALGPSTPFCLPSSLRAVPEGLLDDDGEPQYDAPARAKIEELIKNNKVVLFMKGTRLFPSCGFSNTAIRILDQLNVEYETVDVLADERIRGEIKRYSAWPTIPQLYLQGDFIGGSDIILEMYQTGELQEMIEIAAAS